MVFSTAELHRWVTHPSFVCQTSFFVSSIVSWDHNIIVFSTICYVVATYGHNFVLDKYTIFITNLYPNGDKEMWNINILMLTTHLLFILVIVSKWLPAKFINKADQDKEYGTTNRCNHSTNGIFLKIKLGWIFPYFTMFLIQNI